MTTYAIITYANVTHDEDGYCVDMGAPGETLDTFEADYPGAVRAMANDLRARVEARGIRLERGFATVDAVLGWEVVGGGHVAVKTVEA